MLQLFKKTLMQSVQTLAEAVAPIDTAALVKRIHNEFNSANSIPIENNFERGRRLSDLGFTGMPEARMFQEKEQEREYYETAQKYSVFYPNNKFIAHWQVYNICEKYGLKEVRVNEYKGAIPEKNLKEIETFKLRNEDAYYDDWEPASKSEYDSLPEDKKTYYTVGTDYNTKYYQKKVKLQYPFFICAPEKDTIPDPVVLQQVVNGYLIVTAWGLPDDASMDILNEKMN